MTFFFLFRFFPQYLRRKCSYNEYVAEPVWKVLGAEQGQKMKVVAALLVSRREKFVDKTLLFVEKAQY